jgi:hypothetical protein
MIKIQEKIASGDITFLESTNNIWMFYLNFIW